MITTGNWPTVVAAVGPTVKMGYDMAGKVEPDEKEMFYTVRQTSHLIETFVEWGDISPMGRHNGTVNYVDVAEGYNFTSTAIEYSQGIKIQRRFIETDQKDVTSALPKKLKQSAQRRVITDVFFPFNNAYNTSITTLDGLQWCSAAHTSNNGGSNQSNRGTSTLSPVSVEATRINIVNQLTNSDNKMYDNTPDTILVPENLFSTGWEIISSPGKPDTANNNKNVAFGKYKLIWSKNLDDTNNWFMFNSRLLKECMWWGDIVKEDFNQAKDFDDYAAKFSVYMFYNYALPNWRGLFGHEVS